MSQRFSFLFEILISKNFQLIISFNLESNIAPYESNQTYISQLIINLVLLDALISVQVQMFYHLSHQNLCVFVSFNLRMRWFMINALSLIIYYESYLRITQTFSLHKNVLLLSFSLFNAVFNTTLLNLPLSVIYTFICEPFLCVVEDSHNTTVRQNKVIPNPFFVFSL